MNMRDLGEYDVSGLTGFAYERRMCALPKRIGLDELNRLSDDLPELSGPGNKELLRRRIMELEKESFNNLMLEQDVAVKRLAFAQLSHLTAVYLNHVDGEPTLKKRILPAVIALPLFTVARELGQPAALSHAYAVLCNWVSASDKRNQESLLTAIDTPALEDIDLLVKISNDIDYKWFFTVPCRIEMDAASGIAAGMRAIEAFEQEDLDSACCELKIARESLVTMKNTLCKMYTNCSPNVFYHGFRRYLQSLWPFETEKGSGKLSELLYSADMPDLLPRAGATAAQSSALPFFDRLFSIRTPDQRSASFLEEMIAYMPKRHRQFLSLVQSKSSVSARVRELSAERNPHGETVASLINEYNGCIEAIASFRTSHFEIVRKYIIEMSRVADTADSGMGTGGSSLEHFLQCLLQATKEKLVS